MHILRQDLFGRCLDVLRWGEAEANQLGDCGFCWHACFQDFDIVKVDRPLAGDKSVYLDEFDLVRQERK